MSTLISGKMQLICSTNFGSSFINNNKILTTIGNSTGVYNIITVIEAIYIKHIKIQLIVPSMIEN